MLLFIYLYFILLSRTDTPATLQPQGSLIPVPHLAINLQSQSNQVLHTYLISWLVHFTGLSTLHSIISLPSDIQTCGYVVLLNYVYSSHETGTILVHQHDCCHTKHEAQESMNTVYLFKPVVSFTFSDYTTQNIYRVRAKVLNLDRSFHMYIASGIGGESLRHVPGSDWCT